MNRVKTNKVYGLPAIKGISTACLVGLLMTSNVYATDRDQAKRMHDRLAGVPPTAEVLCAMETLIAASDDVGAANIVMETGTVTDPSGTTCSGGSGTIDNSNSKKAFYSVSLKNFATPWTNEDQTVFAPLNDFTATIIGMVRDDRDFREALTGNYVYVAGGVAGNYANDNNTSYENLENNDADLSDSAVLDSVTQSSAGMAGGNDPGGVMTTRAAGLAFYKDGTNRAAFRYTALNFMCRDMEQLKDPSGIPDRIHQDVTRSPGGDSSIFLNGCIGCHIGMDALLGAYAYYEWNKNEQGDGTDLGNLTYSTTIVHDLKADPPIKHKFLINANNFPYGYVTIDDSWKNYWRSGTNSNLGWANNTDGSVVTGNGLNSMSGELANTEAFAQCQVEKVYTHVCLQPPIDTHQTAVAAIKTSFMSGYNLKDVFASTAALCSGN